MENETPEKGYLITYGLNTGQALVTLSDLEPVLDCGVWLIAASGGETVTVSPDAVIYTRIERVDIPSEEEVEAYRQKIKSLASSGHAGTLPSGNYL